LLRRVEADQRFRLTPRLEASSIDVLRRYALGGHAVTLLPAFVVAPEIQAGRLVVRPLTDRLMEEATSHILVRAQRRLPKPVERLIGFLSTRMEAFRASTL
jgi:DNA-binding transcriptional LysR family regulator